MIKFIIISLILLFVVARFFDYILYIVRLLSGREEDETSTFQKRRDRKDGEMEVQFNNNKRKRKPFTGGEYIDFEEVKKNDSKN